MKFKLYTFLTLTTALILSSCMAGVGGSGSRVVVGSPSTNNPVSTRSRSDVLKEGIPNFSENEWISEYYAQWFIDRKQMLTDIEGFFTHSDLVPCPALVEDVERLLMFNTAREVDEKQNNKYAASDTTQLKVRQKITTSRVLVSSESCSQNNVNLAKKVQLEYLNTTRYMQGAQSGNENIARHTILYLGSVANGKKRGDYRQYVKTKLDRFIIVGDKLIPEKTNRNYYNSVMSNYQTSIAYGVAGEQLAPNIEFSTYDNWVSITTSIIEKTKNYPHIRHLTSFLGNAKLSTAFISAITMQLHGPHTSHFADGDIVSCYREGVPVRINPCTLPES